jgi:CRISPR system Cascade subunit CasA
MDNPLADRSVPRGYLDYLTWPARRACLFPEPQDGDWVVREVQLTQGLALDGEILDPMKHHVPRGRSMGELRFREDRALWRDSAALLQLGVDDYHPPQVFDWLAELVDAGYLSAQRLHRYMAVGLCSNRGKVDFYRTEHLPLPLRYLRNPELVQRLATLINQAEAVSRQLWSATRVMALYVLSPNADTEGAYEPDQERDIQPLMDSWACERGYWAALETPFLETMVALPDDPEGCAARWVETLRHAAWGALGQVTRRLQYDMTALKAVVKSRQRLGYGLNEALGKTPERVEI